MFPNHNKERVGFHLRRGGYPVALLYMREVEEGDYRLQPFTIGHEVGEVIFSQMLRGESGGIGQSTLMRDHILREGFCNAIGLDYYNRFAGYQEQMIPFTEFDELYLEELKSCNLGHLSNEVPYEDFSFEEKRFVDYVLGGSFVWHLVKKYSLARVAEYFVREGKRLAKENEEFEKIMRELEEKLGGILKMSFRAEKLATPVERKELNELLTILGYQQLQFPRLDSSCKPVDEKPEGAIAAYIIDTFHEWFGTEEGAKSPAFTSEERQEPRTKPRETKLTFIKSRSYAVSF